jgi:cytochrome c
MIGLAALMSLSAAPAQADMNRGRAYAQQHCSQCHAIGPGRSRDPRALPFREIRKHWDPTNLDEFFSGDFVEIGRNGHPALLEISPKPRQADDVINFIHRMRPRM